MALTRESRMLIMLLVFGIGSVVALAWMADRYSKMLAPEEEPAHGSASGGSAPRLPKGAVGDSTVATPSLTPEEREQQAARDARESLDRFIGVRAAVRRAGEQLAVSAPGGLTSAHRDILLAQLDRELRHAGLASRDYRTLDKLYRNWRSGEALAEPFKSAFDARRSELKAADWSGLTIMGEAPSSEQPVDASQAAESLPADSTPD